MYYFTYFYVFFSLVGCSSNLFLQGNSHPKSKLYANENFARSSHYNNEAIKYEKLGEYEKALEYNQKSLAINLKYFPKEYGAISINYDNIGVVYTATSQYDK
ncbi:MAG: hypothetical protein DSZ07_04660, partial [Sulfurovum sp.]